MLTVVDVVVLVVVLEFVAVVVASFLLVVLMCCDADASRRGVDGFMSFSSNQNHHLAGALPQLPILKTKGKYAKTRLGTFDACGE